MLNQFVQANFGVTGGLYSNIIASALLGTAAFLYGRVFEKRALERHEVLKAHISLEHKRSRKHLENTLANGKVAGTPKPKQTDQSGYN